MRSTRDPQEPSEGLRQAVDALDDLVAAPGSAHPLEDVAVVRTADGSAYFAPRALRDLDEHQAEVVAGLQRAALAVLQVQQLLAEHVESARDVGLSWSSIGWCVGTTGEAVRQRYGGPRE